MTRTGRSIEDRLLAAQIAIHNALDDESLQSYLTPYSYDREKLEAGRALYEATLEAQKIQQAEYGDQYDATDRLNRLWEEANAAYMHYVKVARVAFRDQRGVMSRLDLHGRRKRATAGWIVQTRQFYEGLLADDDLLARMAEFSITQAKLEAGRAQVDAVEEANRVQAKERGEAQDATLARDVALDALDAWMSDFIAIARLALEERPQYLEKLGGVERS